MSARSNQAYSQLPAAAYAQYGSVNFDDEAQVRGPEKTSSFKRRRHSTLNFGGVIASIIFPCAVFTVVCALLSFSLHYHAPHVSRALCAVVLIVVLILGYMTHARSSRKPEGVHRPARDSFLFMTCLLGWIAGVVLGQLNFEHNMSPFFDVTHMNTYPSVDPSTSHGQQLMDAGRIIFASGSRLDFSKSMGFRSHDMHCVVPITIGTSNLSSYDFWAVGMNCCSGHADGFRCGQYSNPRASAGLRLLREDRRDYFRLAVQQAEAAYHIRASHPVFLTWVQDPVAEMDRYQHEGCKYFLLGVFSFLVFQLFAVAVTAVIFSKVDG
mmetsp:Transcript_114017/g.333208  ORF Transcript_114017/g.333208 Transcript_114017/m.333208 type:complete len:324 (+) Transcript_114017:99-1070(+)